MRCARTAFSLLVWLVLIQPLFAGMPSRFHELAQIADGGDANLWMKTTILVVNQGVFPREAQIELSFFADNGTPLSIPLGGTSYTVYTDSVPAGGMLKLTTQGLGSPLKVGWATLEANRDVGVQVFFELYEKGVLVTQAAVEPLGPMHSVNLFADFKTADGTNTGFAIVNLCDETSITALFVALDENGDPWFSGNVTLEPLGHRARYLDELLNTNDFRGTVKVTATGPFSLVALQQQGLIIGTLAPTRRSLSGRWGGDE